MPEVERINAVQLENFETMLDHSTGGFSGVTLSPIRNTNPITQFSAVIESIQFQTYRPAKLLEVLKYNREDGPSRFLTIADEFFRIRVAVRMRNPQSRSRDLARSSEANDFRNIASLKPAQKQTRRLEPSGHDGYEKYGTQIAPMCASRDDKRVERTRRKILAFAPHEKGPKSVRAGNLLVICPLRGFA